MKFLSEAITIVRNWIIRVISQAGPESVGRVVVSVEEPTPLPPTDPPHLCAYEAQQVETLGAQLETILAQYTTAVEAFTECMESTIATAERGDFNVGQSNVQFALKYMRQNLTSSRAILRKMRSK
jgi:hypothetical protein